ncbi:hypothetical protein BO94DRAFT_534239 [Aspergillus sclerotioniger CBS 115572]|uniref:SAP domain-containing protein n=1 Tax=Aspergillus sclerotioniger CBS 115572 TaxID=1450535 RepID=A0A317WTP7_9EURO|nr:hypothetical protein BO94DRAFT_534239 [Aspergillus sclerotioniger CBS 115572]PWY89465.1 hypothetical protein BO94DRAFT_534239 [Aspergillus sclerotioniger CBS 115572]
MASTDYTKKTNAELIDILKSRNLPHTGKKAEMVARLQEDDTKSTDAADAAAPVPAADAPASATKPDTADDVIDWEDDEVPAADAAEKATAAAGGKGEVDTPAQVPNQKQDVDPATTDDLKVEATGGAPVEQEGEKEEDKKEGETATTEAAAAEEVKATEEKAEEKTEEKAEDKEEKPAVDYSAGLPVTELEEEMKKRKARAEKFGITEESKAAIEAAEKQLERAKRFGTAAASAGEVGVKKLDQALPEKEEKSRKRTRPETDQAGRGGKKRDVGGRNKVRGRGRGGSRNQPQGRPQRQQNGAATAAAGTKTRNWSDKDVQAMEARKKRFAAA